MDLGQEGRSSPFNAFEQSMAPSPSLVPRGPDANKLQKTLLMARESAREINMEKSVQQDHSVYTYSHLSMTGLLSVPLDGERRRLPTAEEHAHPESPEAQLGIPGQL